MPRNVTKRSAPSLRRIAHVHVDHVRSRVEVVAPHVAEQLFPRQHLPGMAQERLRQRKLPRRQIHRATIHFGLSRTQIQMQTTAGQHGQLRCAIRRQPHPDASQQFFEPERLGHVIVGAAFQPGDRIVHAGARRQHDHRNRMALRP